ncbi:MAG: RDD family protein [Mogibacterium sp.]|nr:RDD family protein [Mogibacterium sp.]
MAGKKTMRLASRGKRFGAACIDIAVPLVVYIIGMIIIASAGARSMRPYGYGFGNDFNDFYGYGYGYGYDYNPGMSGAAIAVFIILFLIMIAYLVVECVFYSKSKSIGKVILGLQVVSSKDGTPLGFWKMLLRECIVKNADAPLMLGYIWILIDDKNRAWHDKILDTYVVDLKESERLDAIKRRERARAQAASQTMAPMQNQSQAMAQAQSQPQAYDPLQMKGQAQMQTQTPAQVQPVAQTPVPAAAPVMAEEAAETAKEEMTEAVNLTDDIEPEADFELVPEAKAEAGEGEGSAVLELAPEEPKTADADEAEKADSDLVLTADEAASDDETIADEPDYVPVEEAAEAVNDAAKI